MAQSFRLRFDGAPVERAIREAAGRGLYLATEHVLGKSNDVVPLDEAELQRSGVASVDEGTLTGAISYDTPYAVVQHERMDFRHAPGRTAKYLENSLNGARGEVMDIIAAQVRRALR
ncbi:minor capsid protein [Streptomyces longhuiensis]|uniref:minor capsid protein n=1 Tax=Streptomyces longhuiensis TaxID=2880933 RepID=UPI001D0B0A03|nr:minor capsid protein [Streptomyces longhuiensis]UDM00083.1 minor capsid protein [Streptomyces longhuiensis]